MTGGLFGLGAGTPSRFPYPGRPQPSPAVGPSSATIVRANRVIVTGPNGGIYVYSGPPASGNLIESIGIVSAGLDPFGLNAVLPGDTRYHNNGAGVYVAQQSTQAYVAYLWQASSPLGPYTATGTYVSFTNEFTSAPLMQLAGNLTEIIGKGGLTQGIVFVAPSGDTSGATDGANIATALALGAVQLLPGIFYVNAPVEVPAGGMLGGAGRSTVDLFSSQTIIRATAAMAAVVCSGGWLENTNISTQASVYLHDFKVDGNSLATHGIVLQNEESLVVNCQAGTVTTDAFRLDGLSQDGTTALTGSGVNCRFVDCLGEDCSQAFHTNDPNGKFTDGFLVNCHGATISGVAAITIFNATGWLITGCHVYGLSQNGIQVGQTFMTRVVNNYVETWGGTATAGTWRAIDAFFRANSDEGSGSVIAGNTLDCHAAPGNAASIIEGIGFRGANANTATVAITGNLMRCAPSSGFASSNAIGLYGGGSTAILIVTSTGNNPTGHWTNNVFQSAGGGTITLSAGV